MRSGDVNVGLGDDAHAEVVESSSQEARERGQERDRAVTTRQANCHLEVKSMRI